MFPVAGHKHHLPGREGHKGIASAPDRIGVSLRFFFFSPRFVVGGCRKPEHAIKQVIASLKLKSCVWIFAAYILYLRLSSLTMEARLPFTWVYKAREHRRRHMTPCRNA